MPWARSLAFASMRFESWEFWRLGNQINEKLGSCRIPQETSLLGEGSFGTVYEVDHKVQSYELFFEGSGLQTRSEWKIAICFSPAALRRTSSLQKDLEDEACNPDVFWESPCSAQACEACAVGLSRSDMTSQADPPRDRKYGHAWPPQCQDLRPTVWPKKWKVFHSVFCCQGVLGCQENFSNCN